MSYGEAKNLNTCTKKDKLCCSMKPYLMMRMVVVGLWSEGVKTTATSLASQGCSSSRRTPPPVMSSTFSPACTQTRRRCVKRLGEEATWTILNSDVVHVFNIKRY